MLTIVIRIVKSVGISLSSSLLPTPSGYIFFSLNAHAFRLDADENILTTENSCVYNHFMRGKPRC